MVGAVIIGMKKELNDKKKDVGRHIMEDLTTDARAITEGARSNAEACSDTTDHFTGAAVSFRSFAGEWCEFEVQHFTTARFTTPLHPLQNELSIAGERTQKGTQSTDVVLH